jgi:heat shock protein HslJ
VKKGGAAGGSAGSAAKLRGTLWRLIELRGADGAVVKPDDPEKYTFELESDGRVGVRADCNRGMGRYALEGGTLTFTVLAYTKAMCPPGSLYDSYTQALEKTASFAIKDGALTLTLAADAGAMTFEPAK